MPWLDVMARVGPMSKSLKVFGKRTWRKGLLGRSGFSEPEAFVTAPIAYENAFGGPRSKKNPVGRGMDSDDLPLVENPQRLLATPAG